MYTNVLTKILPSSPKKSPDPGNLQKTTARSSKILSINLLYCVTIYMAAFWTQTQLRTTEPLYGVCEVRLLFTVQSLSRVWLCDPVNCSTPVSPSFTVSRNLLKLMSIEPVMPSNHLVLCHPPLLAGVKGQMKTSLSTTGNQRMENGFRSKLKVFLSPKSHEKWSWCFDEGGGGPSSSL